MKKYILIFAMVFFACSSAKTLFAEDFMKKEVIIFSQDCYYCGLMKKDLDSQIIPKNTDIKFTILDINESKNNKLLREYAKRYQINGKRIGLPLIFIGDHFMMGWGENAVAEMQEYIDDFKKEMITRVPIQ